jgi:hypothetical protein
MYLKTLALPKAQAMPRMNISAVNSIDVQADVEGRGPLTVRIVKSVCG